MNNYIKEIRAILIFIMIGAVIFGFTFAISYLKLQNYVFGSIVFYTIGAVLLSILNSLLNSAFIKTVLIYYLFPAQLFWVLGNFLMPFGVLFIHFLLYILISFFIPESLYWIYKLYDLNIFSSDTTILYLRLTISTFIAVIFNYQLRHFIYAISPARLKTSKKLKPYELDKLTDYLLSDRNVRFLIYSGYFFLLFINNIMAFENKTLTSTILNDKAILQSFVTFIAFDRALALLKQLEFKPSDFLKRIVDSIRRKFNQEIGNDDNIDLPKSS